MERGGGGKEGGDIRHGEGPTLIQGRELATIFRKPIDAAGDTKQHDHSMKEGGGKGHFFSKEGKTEKIPHRPPEKRQAQLQRRRDGRAARRSKENLG